MIGFSNSDEFSENIWGEGVISDLKNNVADICNNLDTKFLEREGGDVLS